MDVFKSNMMKSECPHGCKIGFKCPECNLSFSNNNRKKHKLKNIYRKIAKAKLKRKLLLEINI